MTRLTIRTFVTLMVLSWGHTSWNTAALAEETGPIFIGLDADMSSGAAEGGEAIRRGGDLAIRDINGKGGVLGRPLKMVVRDHRGNPARGKDNILEFAAIEQMVAVLGGIHTPVALHELKDIHDGKLIYLSPWAAGTPIVDNGHSPNYVFRISVRDALAGGFMVDQAIKSGHKKLGLLFERTGWGRSNERAVKTALKKLGMEPVGLEWFNWGVVDVSAEVDRLIQRGADAVILVANPREGGIALKAMADRPKNKRIPIISHWGITGGNFFADNRDALANVNFSFLQTFSFLKPPFPDRAKEFFAAYQRTFPETMRPENVLSPVGAAHAYDIIQILAKAVTMAGTTDRPKVRDALENIKFYAGLMKDYAPPFTPTRHDALDSGSFIMARYDANGAIRPLDLK